MSIKETLVAAKPVPKAGAATLAGAVSILLVAVLDRAFNVSLTPVEASAITTVFAFIGAWLAPRVNA
jgi:uncharacterized protein (DUF697 family)